jgi:outer membrane protein TolC
MSARKLASALAALALGGCATFSDDRGLGEVGRVVKARGGSEIAAPRSDDERAALDARVAELLAKKPLGADDAVQIALYNNAGLQASFHELGALEADVVQAGRLPNPRFSMLRASKREPDGGREYKIEQALTANIFALATMPLARAVEERRFAAAQRALALEVLGLASDTRKAYYAAVAAEESVRYMRQVQRLAEASAELARRMARAGNFNKLQQAREQSFYADAALALARAEHASVAARERLIRLMGLWGTQTRFELAERQPDLPGEPGDLPDIEREAIAERLDVQSARTDTEALARNLGLTKVTRFLTVLEFGPARVLEGEKRAPSRSTWPRCSARPRSRSTRAPRCARPITRTGRATTSRVTIATRSCRSGSASPTRTCCATTAC